MNSGEYGTTQVGKFITIYPSGALAVELAKELHEVTRDFTGPEVPSDHRLRHDSIVSYRYGAFRTVANGDPGNDVLLDIAGRIRPDYRLPYYYHDGEPPDPFLAASVAEPDERNMGPFAKRFLILGAIRRAVWGRVYDAIDLQASPPHRCILKEFWHDAAPDAWGRDASHHAALEADVLRNRSDILPELYDTFEHQRNIYLVVEHIAGQTLTDRFDLGYQSQGFLSGDQILRLGTTLAQAIKVLHQQKVIHRDINPSNVMVDIAETIRLIDVAFAYRPGLDVGPPLGIGTPGFMSPQQAGQLPPSYQDDLYSWGSTLYTLATKGNYASMDMGDVSTPVSRRPLTESRPDLPLDLCSIIDRAIADSTESRFQDIDELLKVLQSRPIRSPHTFPSSHSNNRQSDDHRQLPYSELALSTGRALDDFVQHAEDGCTWRVAPEGTNTVHNIANLYSGTAGIGLFLATLGSKYRDDRSLELAKEAARWLSTGERAYGSALCGLYTGEAGIGYFYLRLAALIGEPGYINMAALRARRLFGINPPTCDLVDGSAGLLCFLSHLANATDDLKFKSYADSLARIIIDSAMPSVRANDGIYWDVPSATPGGAPKPYLGLLHGAAGIGFALLLAGQMLRQEEFISAAVDVGNLLLKTAHVDDEEGVALRWPEAIGDDRVRLTAHCHGAGGIAQFLIRLWRACGDHRFLDAARRAACSASVQSFTHSSHCHGVTGWGELMIDLYQVTREQQYLDKAKQVGLELNRFSTERPGIWSRISGGKASVDLMTGSSGIAMFLLRLESAGKINDAIPPSLLDSS